MPAVTENQQSSPNEETEYPLENYVGNVYIGSPQRRRHYLEPLNVRKKTPSPKVKDGKKTVCICFILFCVQICQLSKLIPAMLDF